MRNPWLKASSLVLGCLSFVCISGNSVAESSSAASMQPRVAAVAATASEQQLDRYLAQYAPYKMHYDASSLAAKDKQILQKLVKAAELLHEAYWAQTSPEGRKIRDTLVKGKHSPQARKLLTLLDRNGGVFEQLNGHAAFMGSDTYYPGQAFYPEGMTAEQFDHAIARMSAREKAEFLNPYTVIREDGKGGYKAVRFYDAFKSHIDPVIALLNEAADLTDNASFARFLRLKARALKTDEYFEADVAWIDLSGNQLDIVFGPFETYDDGIKGVKAKYQAYIEIVDKEESAKLDTYTQYLPQMEAHLPIPEEYKSVIKGLTTKFVVVRDIMRTGMGIVGYQAVATNLPNDPRVHEQKGTKKTFWKNMFKARFDKIIKPVSERLIAENQLQHLSNDGFFQFVLMHEISHALGPRTVKTGPYKGTAVNEAIGPDYSPLEEAKADITGLYSLAYLMDRKVLEPNRRKNFYISYLGSLFRSIRFGMNQAHGKAAILSLNYFLHHGGLVYNKNSGRWTMNFERFPDNVESLARELLILEGDGDSRKVKDFFNQWAKISPPVQQSMDRVSDLAIDVLPQYSIKWD